MMLLIDAGNTRLKWCWYDDGQLPIDYHSCEYEDFDNDGVKVFVSQGHDTDDVLVCNVAGEEMRQDLVDAFASWDLSPRFVSSASSCCGVTNAYGDPGQLGVDRWMCLIGAWSLEKDALCVVDCGTAVTIDVLDDTGKHLGGLIIPGMEMMQYALTDETGIRLEQQDESADRKVLLADNTTQAVEAGTIYAIVALIDRVRDDIEREVGSSIPLLITGGDVDLIQPLLSGESRREPMLIFHGMIACHEQS